MSDISMPLALLFDKDDLPRLRANAEHPIFREYWKELTGKPVADLASASLHDAFVYLITGDEGRAESAKSGLMKVIEWERWDFFCQIDDVPIGFLKTSRLTLCCALMYDWLYDRLSSVEQDKIKRTVAHMGCVPIVRGLQGMLYPDQVKGWTMYRDADESIKPRDMRRWPQILGNNNFRAVMCGGLAMGLVLLDGFDERADEWRELLIENFHACTGLYTAEGSYDEGVSYANYATQHMIYATEILRRHYGVDLRRCINYPGLIRYNNSMFLPHQQEPRGSINFGDAGNSLRSDVCFWIAGMYRDGLAQYTAREMSAGHVWSSLVWYDESVAPEQPVVQNLVKLDFDWIIARDGYGQEDLVAAMRSGGPSNHEHGDRNSLLLKYAGEILLSDPKHPTYNNDEPGWFLRTPEAHNCLLVDGKGHPYISGAEGTNASEASARIIRWEERDGYAYWSSDASNAYIMSCTDVESVIRTVYVFFKTAAVIVIDKARMAREDHTITARWHVENSDGNGTVIAAGSGFRTTRPGGFLLAECTGSGEITIETACHPLPEESGKHHYVDCTLRTTNGEALLVTAGCAAKNGEEDPQIDVVKKDGKHTVSVRRGDETSVLHIINDPWLPVCEVKQSC